MACVEEALRLPIQSKAVYILESINVKSWMAWTIVDVSRTIVSIFLALFVHKSKTMTSCRYKSRRHRLNSARHRSQYSKTPFFSTFKHIFHYWGYRSFTEFKRKWDHIIPPPYIHQIAVSRACLWVEIIDMTAPCGFDDQEIAQFYTNLSFQPWSHFEYIHGSIHAPSGDTTGY